MSIMQIETGFCGIGISRGLFKEYRLGWLRVTLCGARFAEAIDASRAEIGEAHQALKVADRVIIRQGVTIRQLELRLEQLTHPARDPVSGRFVGHR